KTVTEVKPVTRTYSVCVPTYEERECMTTKVVCKPYTTTVNRCVDKGHFECRQVVCCEKPKHHCCKKSCCDDCCCCVKTVSCWVPNIVTEQCQVTCYKSECVQVPVKVKVCVYKHETRTETCNVTCCKCVPEQRTETYTCMVPHKVAYQATRTCCKCVP